MNSRIHEGRNCLPLLCGLVQARSPPPQEEAVRERQQQALRNTSSLLSGWLTRAGGGHFRSGNPPCAAASLRLTAHAPPGLRQQGRAAASHTYAPPTLRMRADTIGLTSLRHPSAASVSRANQQRRFRPAGQSAAPTTLPAGAGAARPGLRRQCRGGRGAAMVCAAASAGRLGPALPFLIVLLDLQYHGAECGINAEVEKQLEMGKKLLAAGQLADALSHFHAAIEGDSDNYIAYYRRATVYLAMGKSKAAIRDLSKVVELKQDFTSARLQRGHLLLKQGKFDEAEDDFKNVLKSNPSNNEEKEAQTQLTKSDELQRLHSQALSAYQQEDYEAAISLLDEILAVCVWDAELRELRAECYIKEGEPSKAISDLKAAAKLKNDNTEAFYKISRIYYQLGDHELSLSEVRECLKLDQDHKQCFSLYKQVKKLNKQIESAEEFIREGRYEDAINKYDSVMKTEPDVPIYATRAKERICHCLSKNQQATEAIKVCTEVLQLEPTNVNALKDRAEAYLLEDLYEEAIKDYETAQANSENDQQIREGLERAQRMLKQSQKRDYYKILGVKRNARKQEIIKAYRKLASQWHPDNFQSEEEKKKAEKKFIDIAAAKEVLTDPEMRRKFDAGEDPLDAESQQGGGNPFHRNWNTWQGFNPFGSGGGPFTFKFHFS
uniref:DnaJ homolog subfamily C member 3 n=2 Tax=Anser cygnoides TaxID=8845 RepID=A0A8B9EQD6_ANSCY